MIENAIIYAKMGLPVFPVYEPIDGKCSCGRNCESPAKHPRTMNGLKDATTNEEMIKKWWMQWPNANIGMATGLDNRGIIDLDGPIGLESGRKLGLQSTVKTLTGGGGEHLWYRVPEGKKLVTRQAKKIAQGVDTRGTGGYVLLPPSLHISGKRYTWAGPLPQESLLPSLPHLFIHSEERQSVLVKANAPTWVDEALEKFENGHVANTLVSLLGKFKAHNFSEEVTYKLLQPRNKSGEMTDEELRSKIHEIYTRYASAPVVGITEDINQFLEQITEVSWICEPFFAKKSIGFVVGLPETLKTWLCIDLAVECARESGLWLGKFPVTNCRVLFIDQERFKGETQKRFRAVIAAKGLLKTDLSGKLSVKCGTTIRLNLEESFQAFRRELLSIQPDLIIVDSFATFHTAPENDRMEIQKVLNLIKQLREEIGCTFLFINHENKTAYPNGEPQGEPHIGTMTGSIGIPAAAEFCVTVRKVEDGTSMVWHTKSTMAKKSKPFYATVKDVERGIEVKAVDA